MADRNFYSFNGPADSGRTVAVGDVFLDPAVEWASALKFSTGLRDFRCLAASVPGGHDACLDVNNLCADLLIIADELIPNGNFAATIKGGARNITTRVKRLLGHGKVCDVMLDDWSDQSHAPTENILLDWRTDDGSPVTVVALKARPRLAPGSGPYRFLIPAWLNPRLLGYPIGAAFEVLRRWGFFRSAANGASP